jgi:hypothetical protein
MFDHSYQKEQSHLLLGRIQVYPVVMMEVSTTLGLTAVVVRHPKKTKPMADTLSLIKDSLACIGLSQKTLTVYPNPVAKGNSITVSARFDQPGTYRVQLFSLSGVVLESLEVNGQGKSENILMTLPAYLAPGTYIVRISHPSIKKDYTNEIVVL